MTQERKKFSPERLRDFCATILEKAKAHPEDAAVVADSMIYADLRGVSSHGLTRLDAYLKRIEAGVLNREAKMPLLRDSPACALMDAENGFGQVAGVKAVDLAVCKAESIGVGIVAVKNSNHFGVSAYYAVRATRRNMAAIVFTNAGPAMVPFNGTEPLLGTNPFTAAVPSSTDVPMVLDMATTQVARGKVRRAAAAGNSIPLGWAVDKDGNPTTDAKAALEGTLCPMGGPKGSGLSLMIDLFSGVLSGSCLTGDVKGVTDTSGVARVGHLFIVINPAFFSGTGKFMDDVESVGQRILGQRPADGGRIYLPGEIEAENEQANACGLALAPDTFAQINACAARYGVGPLE
ncbi:Malate/L-lactate dehydrogenase [uncultured delta proteobacterium]|uniref:Malate/L-lactate dehydrogenase n=1 Tax=uncultured delta proteobacterium TaxID=34034 RepID=A0A212IZK4_9DELT|nr:Malate/L-lactate dehydrogenase [uncultured delta proteobacterium]